MKTAKEAVEVFKGMFDSEKFYYRHLKKHIIDKTNIFVQNWINAREMDIQFKYKFSIDYLKFFLSSIKSPSTILYYKPDKDAKPYVVIYSKRNSLTLILEGNRLISVQKLKKDLEEWKEKKMLSEEEIFEVGKDEKIIQLGKRISELSKRFNNFRG